MDKYYIPKINEFYIGFEYEELCKNFHYHKLMKPKEDVYEWINIKFDTSKSFSTISSKIKQDKIRVKYLDNDDIESFGFTHLPKQSLKNLTERFEIKGLYRRINEQYNDIMYWNIYLEYSPDIHRVIIKSDISDGLTDEKFFEGVINNKSELKVLLTQLNII